MATQLGPSTTLNPAAPSFTTNVENNQTTQLEEGNIITSMLAKSSHPIAILFHYAFRSLALFIYLFGGIFASTFASLVILIIVLLVLDFWTVKNVTGRLLVGRRWWNMAGMDGTVWTFEARPASWKVNPIDSRLFWVALYGYTIIWMLLGLVALVGLELSWLLVVTFALTLNITNLIGYIKCDREAQSQVLNNWGSTFMGSVFGGKFSSVLS